MGNTTSITEGFNYSSILEETEDISKGLGAIHRHFECRDGLKKKYDDNVNNLYDNFLHAHDINPENKCYGYRPIVDNKAQDFKWFSYAEVKTMIKNYANGLVELNLLNDVNDPETKNANGSPVCAIGHYQKNCYELCVSQFAVWKINGCVVPIYDTFGTEAVGYMIEQTNLKTIFCSLDKAFILLNNMKNYKKNYQSLKNIIVKEELTEELKELARVQEIQLYTFHQILEIGKKREEEAYVPAHEEDLCMIMFTSGTTGVPKGVLVSHLMLLSEATSCVDHLKRCMEWGPEDSHLSYLPMAHIFEHFVQTTFMIIGGHVGFYQGSPSLLTDDLRHFHPTIFASVPRLYGKIVDTILKTVKSSSYMVQTLFNYAFEVKKQNLLKYNVVESFWDSIVFNKVKAKCGLENVKFMLSGSAPLAEDLMLKLRVIFGTHMCQGFGMTETAGGLCCSSLDDMNTFNHCGGPIITAEARLISVPDMGYLITDRCHNRIVTVKDGEEVVENEGISCFGRGEIVFRGYNISKGYFKNKDLTALTIDKDGWFHSGDIGIWTENGCLQIVDKIKALFKLSQGEYISPDRIQGVYAACPYINNIYVYGDSYQSYLVGIVVPEEEALRKYLKDNNIEIEGTFEELCKSEEIKKIIFKELKKVDEHSTLMSFEKVKNIYLSSEVWTIENNMLTPTMKLKREVGEKKYKSCIEQLYKEGMYTL